MSHPWSNFELQNLQPVYSLPYRAPRYLLEFDQISDRSTTLQRYSRAFTAPEG